MLLYYQTSLRWEILECEANKMMRVSKEIPNSATLHHLGQKLQMRFQIGSRLPI